ncbi:hypothetical protein CBR_g6571 [Chara braunii]|uniref:DUF659 domain-containing protein n=1 Tax=Chara braunii TaxID=69332 RepID=A0A388KKF2_CHABU|nr:hypothetical protein CBR_g6571 [Chara braunii]|eukprot:GBG70443.1 hypothetical protein CBR_g6571 [Chara braunii]
MPRSQSRVFEDGGEDENLKAQKRCCVYKYIRVGQSLGERFRGNRMLKCIFCGHEFQGNQFVAARHFRQGKGCPEVTDEALVDIHYNSEYKMSDKFLQRIQQFEELHGPTPAMDPRRDEGGEGETRDAEEQIDVHDDVKEVARAGSSGRERGKGVVSEPGGQQGQYFPSAHVSARTRGGADTAEAGLSAGKRKEREEGTDGSTEEAEAKHYLGCLAFNVFRSEPWLDVVRHFRELSGPVKVLWPSENEIADMETIVHTADDVGADLAEVRAPFYVTGATIMSDRRKSRDARPIANFLAGGSRGVMLVRTMNREGERDGAPDVLAHWIKVFEDFSPRWVNAICIDSALAYVAAANMLQGPKQRPEHRRITWLPCAVHVCNKMLSDIGCSGAWSKDIVVRGRAVVRFIKEHGAALHIFRGESRQMGLIYPCEIRFASVFAMVERLLAVRSALERTVDGDTWGMVPWDHSVRHLPRWVRWQVRHGSWWDSMAILFRVMEPVYDLLRRLDRGGLHMSRVVEWTQDLARQVAEEVCALPTDLAHHIVQRVQARCAHMLEPAHAADHLLCPSRRDLRYFEGVVSDYDASLVREARRQRCTEVHGQCGDVHVDVLLSCGEELGRIGIRPSWKGTDESRTREELEEQRRSWQRDPCGSRAPPGDVGDVFGTRATTLHPYPRDDSDSEGDEDEPAGPATAGPAADERDAWSYPEDIRRRSGGDDLFVGVDLEEESRGRHESPPQRQRTTSADPRSLERKRDPGSAPLRGAESGIGHCPARLLQDRLEVGSSPVQGDDGDRQGLARRDGGALAGGGGGAEVAAAVKAHEIRSVEDERIPMTGGGAGFKRLDRLDSRRAGLMAQRDPRTQELARRATEERQRQLGTFTPASVDVAPTAHTDPPAEVHDTPQLEAASAEVLSTGVDVHQGTHESGLAPTEETRSEPVQPPAVQVRPEETLHEVTTVPQTPLPRGLVEGAVQMSPGLEDIQTGQSVSVDDIRPSAQAEGIAATTGGEGAVGVGKVGVPAQADPMSTSDGGDSAQLERREVDGQDMPHTLVVRSTVGPVVPHQAPFFEGNRGRAHGGGLVEERRVGRGACIPLVPTFALSWERPEIRCVATPRGSLPFGFMSAEELEEHDRTDLTEINRCIFKTVPEEGKLPHVEDLSWGPASPGLPSGCSVAAPSGEAAGGLRSRGSVAAASGGAAGDLPSGGSVAAPSGGTAGPSSPMTAALREGGNLTPRSAEHRRRDTAQRARELLDTMLFGRTDRPWSETRRVTTASAGRQPGLRGATTAVRR